VWVAAQELIAAAVSATMNSKVRTTTFLTGNPRSNRALWAKPRGSLAGVNAWR
jgi:hypothetical protein